MEIRDQYADDVASKFNLGASIHEYSERDVVGRSKSRINPAQYDYFVWYDLDENLSG